MQTRAKRTQTNSNTGDGWEGYGFTARTACSSWRCPRPKVEGFTVYRINCRARLPLAGNTPIPPLRDRSHSRNPPSFVTFAERKLPSAFAEVVELDTASIIRTIWPTIFTYLFPADASGPTLALELLLLLLLVPVFLRGSTGKATGPTLCVTHAAAVAPPLWRIRKGGLSTATLRNPKAKTPKYSSEETICTSFHTMSGEHIKFIIFIALVATVPCTRVLVYLRSRVHIIISYVYTEYYVHYTLCIHIIHCWSSSRR